LEWNKRECKGEASKGEAKESKIEAACPGTRGKGEDGEVNQNT